MKRARQLHALPSRRNPVARSPLLGKGGPHGKSQGALRRKANVELTNLRRDPKTFEP